MVLMVSACSDEEIVPRPGAIDDDDIPGAAVNEAHQYVNQWVRDNMQYWYLWNDEIPENIDRNLNPKVYFQSLLHKDDRFSWIQDDYQELVNALQGISREAGYEFVLYRENPNSDHVVLQIVYTKPESPAETAGLKRGDLVSRINGQQLTTTNYRTLLNEIRQNHTLTVQPLRIDRENFGPAQEISVAAVEYAENPNYLHKVLEVDGKKIGYFVYNFFASGTQEEPGKYDAETDAIFATFSTQGITELVIDLRFNSGGSESAANNLASLVCRGITASSIFLKRQYNDIVQQDILNDPNLGEDFLTSYFSVKANNVGSQLSSGRVYILTSARTASASELIINALRPFMEVFLIGETTYGKNVGSITLYAEDDPKNTWGLQPIVVKVYNSLGQSDYGAGFVPDVLHPDNGMLLYPLGDPREALLAAAIAQITGTATTARAKGETRTPLLHSLDLKRSSYQLVMDQHRVVTTP